MTRAAAKLHMTQPALSQALAQLESELGFKLLARHPRGVTLTPAGAAFYDKAREAVAADDEITLTAEALVRARKGTIAFGFVGSPPPLDSPRPLQAFAEAHPKIDIRYHELPFPSLSTSAWLGDVDIASCHTPPEDPEVWTQNLRPEPRSVLAPVNHRLAGSPQLTVEEVLEETFIGFHPSVAPSWAGFWSLDDHRGGPPRRVTLDRVANPQEVVAALAARQAITAVPASVGGLLMNVLSSVVAIPLLDAAPSTIVLAGHRDRRNPLVEVFTAFALARAPKTPQ